MNSSPQNLTKVETNNEMVAPRYYNSLKVKVEKSMVKDIFLLINKNLLTNRVILCCRSGSGKRFLLLVLILLI